MSVLIAIAIVVALLSGFSAIVLGRNLTYSIAAAGIAVLALAIALLASGVGFIALFVAIPFGLILSLVQLFGWMLVDVDRDHVPPTDRVTAFARSLAFLLLAGGLLGLLLMVGPLQGGEPEALSAPGPVGIGVLLLGPWRDLSTLFGLVMAAALLASFMLLRDERPPS
jgi:hypothetical protein